MQKCPILTGRRSVACWGRLPFVASLVPPKLLTDEKPVWTLAAGISYQREGSGSTRACGMTGNIGDLSERVLPGIGQAICES